jgi:hypothetical protein
MKFNPSDRFEAVEVQGKIFLFTNMRVDRDTLPEGCHAYDVRDDDECSGSFTQVQPFVLVNHWGTIIGPEEIDLDESGRYNCTDDDGLFVDFYGSYNDLVAATTYMVVCYNRDGDTDHVLYADTLAEARKARTAWGLSIGLRPEPSIDFGFYPTIWKYNGEGKVRDRSNYRRVMGY